MGSDYRTAGLEQDAIGSFLLRKENGLLWANEIGGFLCRETCRKKELAEGEGSDEISSMDTGWQWVMVWEMKPF